MFNVLNRKWTLLFETTTYWNITGNQNNSSRPRGDVVKIKL